MFKEVRKPVKTSRRKTRLVLVSDFFGFVHEPQIQCTMFLTIVFLPTNEDKT